MTTPKPTPDPQSTASSPIASAHAASGNSAGFEHLTLQQFLAATAAKQPTPGGGAVAGACGALAAALGHMVVAYSIGKKQLVQHQTLLTNASSRLLNAQAMLMELANEDAQAYAMVNQLSKLPEGDARREQLAEATLAAAQIPLALAACCLDVLRLLSTLCGTTNAYLRSDLAIAAVLADATVKCSRWNVVVNLPSIADAKLRESMQTQIDGFVRTSAAITHDVESRCRESW
jgi:formiminotetrahydrofolate cyclodeaminase